MHGRAGDVAIVVNDVVDLPHVQNITTGSGFKKQLENSNASRTDDCCSLSAATTIKTAPDMATDAHQDQTSLFPHYGVKGEAGRRSKMEDAHAVCPDICQVPLPSHNTPDHDRLPGPNTSHMPRFNQTSSAISSDHRTQRNSSDSTSSTHSSFQEYPSQTLHYFGVFDGHAGSSVSHHCSKFLHRHLRNALVQAFPAQQLQDCTADSLSSISDSSSLSVISQHTTTYSELVTSDDAHYSAAHSSNAKRPHLYNSSSHSISSMPDAAKLHAAMQTALLGAFLVTDYELEACGGAAMVGSTAVVALVGKTHIWLANCGDSRAVLCRAGAAIQMTDDHKPNRQDEKARITRAGGFIAENHGQRVQGVLAMSRAMGDHALRPYVVADPEVTYVARRSDDELLLLASDGLWDVLGNQEAATLALRCLQSAQAKGATRSSAARIAAKVLARAAIDSGSKDNVTVLVVDLRR